MDIQYIREHCMKKEGVTEGFPFDEETLVFKVYGRMFLLASLNPPLSINVKCEPEKAIDLRERYFSVLPGFHMDKKHWNTVKLDGSVPVKELLSWIDDSYKLVLNSIPEKKREIKME
jgi:predicted DNA-binding protein (MmcQ/YjbR family)